MNEEKKLAAAILAFVGDYLAAEGKSPSVREIMDGVKVSSTSKIVALLDAMVKDDLLEKPPPGTHRGYRLSQNGRDIYEQRKSIVQRAVKRFHVGRVRAGAMLHEWNQLLSQESGDLYFDRDDRDIFEVSLSVLPDKGDDIFALRVAGDSMVDAMINEGDIVLVQKRRDDRPPKDGTMVVALDRLDGDAVTLKHYHSAGEEVELRPANRDYAPIRIAKRHIDILGTVLMVFRPARQVAPLAVAA